MFLAPKIFFGGAPANFLSQFVKLRQFPIMWQSFRAIGRGISEKAWRKETSGVKHKPVRNGCSGRPNNFRARGSILTGLFSVDVSPGRGDRMGNFYNARPQKFETAKKSPKIFRHFWQLSTLIAKISGKDQHIKSCKSSSSSTTHPTLGEKFGVLWSTNEKVIDSNTCTP